MTIRKLTVAAAIAVGIATCSFNSVMAACPCEERPVVTQGACPCEEMPEITGAACPCEAAPQPDCGCNAAPQCEPDPTPSCALCPGVKDLSRADMKQVYSYPNAIYGYNNFVGTNKDSIYTAEGFSVNREVNQLTAGTMGTTVASDGSMTGAATNIPCLNDMASNTGSPIIRDESKMLGGLGHCGREFCCNKFLCDFQPVSIKMAKEQNMSLNPSKISGNCGRLMCCLKYEQDVYEEKLKHLPKIGAIVTTPDGEGTVDSIETLKEIVKVRLKDDSDETYFKKFNASDLKIIKNVSSEVMDEEEKENMEELQKLEELEKQDKETKNEDDIF